MQGDAGHNGNLFVLNEVEVLMPLESGMNRKSQRGYFVGRKHKYGKCTQKAKGPVRNGAFYF
jgi:hypothetical protein